MEFTAVDDDDETQKPAAQPRPIVEPSTMGMWNPPNTDNNANANDAILPMTDPLASPSLEEMAFLVTHWLSGLRDNGDASAVAKNPRWHKIHSLAGELAHAFTEVGVFPRSYIDWKRTYHQLPTRQLEFIVTAATAQANYASSMVGAHSNVNRIQHAIERRQQQLQSSSSSKPNSGRTLQDAIPLLDDNNKDHDDTDSNKDTNGHAQYYQFSALHPPTVLRFQCCSEETTDQLKVEGAPPVVTLISDRESAQTAANAWREFLGARQQVQQQRSLIRNLQQSYDYHQQQIQIHRNNHHQNINLPLLAQNYNDDEIMVDDDTVLHNCQRAMAHLMRQLPLQSSALQQYEKTYFQCQHRATIEYQKYRKLVTYFRPWTAAISSPDNNKKHHYSTTGVRFLTHIQHRCVYGTNNNNNKSHHLRCQQQNHHKPMAILRSTLAGRFAHAATINAHLSYPVYCLKFDKTGRYFITGADDYLVKVFTIDLQLQHNNPKNSQSRRLLHRDESGGGGTSSNGMIRGAVLVCTLKGHAGVVNDIAVSSDNAFLATASEDGDCRIWGLRDGCQIAVLRGHVGGANMVSWSHLTPYRLVTTSADGLARTWDVRKACLQRYGNIVGRRPEYQKKPKHNTPKTNENDVAAAAENNNNPQSVTDDGIEINETTTTPIHVPPLPLRENGDASVIPLELPPLPPLPPAPGGLMMDPVIPPAAQDNNGDFVANDILDEGVLLIAKLPHGTTLEEQRQGEGGPETRSRRIAVKVICVARCPHGGHFATGSDDGICRIWQEEDNPDVEAADQEAVLSTTARHKNSHQTWHTRSATDAASDRLLLTLKGHMSAITDLQYSSQGNRILTASQKDGIVRITSWSSELCSAATTSSSGLVNQRDANLGLSVIIIKLANPQSIAAAASSKSNVARVSGPRRTAPRAPRNQTANPCCDVAVWVHDDTKIITSQSELVKESGSTIVPGSQYIFLWDSASGHCLLGIAGAHCMQCPVLLPHPLDSSIMCSAGADGFVKLWNWETGQCFYCHQNVAEFGPIDARDKGKSVGYLDGEWSPDGTTLVLTDDSGRVTMFDSRLPAEKCGNPAFLAVPEWMKEQYFSNDYYDLYYDSNGYCVERGSEMPPHLAPKGARCTHGGTPMPTLVNEAFQGLCGPGPISVEFARWERQEIRETAARMKNRRFCRVSTTARGNYYRQYDPDKTQIIQHGVKATLPTSSKVDTSATITQSDRRNSPYRLSSNYRWRDYSDIVEDDQEAEMDTDDEEFQLNESSRGRSGPSNGPRTSDTDDDELDEDVLPDDSPLPSRSRQSSRNRKFTANDEDESDSSDGDFIVEYMSTNNVPSGPFVADYDLHFFKLTNRNQAADINRLWVRRNESTSSYAGRKKYTPQIGDSIVYIPRAHYETITKFPSIDAPWQNWPEEAVWPVVRCFVRNVRYRFPFKDYFRGNTQGIGSCRSIVARLTLEVSGLPELSVDRIVGWPNPNFIQPTKSHVFEVSIFETNEIEYVVPEELYVRRLKELESAIIPDDGNVRVEGFYSNEDAPEDAEFVSFKGRVERYADSEFEGSFPNLIGSGFCSLAVVWDQESGEPGVGEPDPVSPWEVSLVTNSAFAPSRPKLDEDEKKRVREAIAYIKEDPRVDDLFQLPVDTLSYSDYPMRVEVPMDLTFIVNRLEADYYATRYSVVADVRQIHVNSVKYNGENDDVSVIALEMLKKFEERVLAVEEREIFHKFDVPLELPPPFASEEHPRRSSGAVAVRRRAQRPVQSEPSSLLSMFQQQRESLATETRSQRERRHSGARRSARQAQTQRSVLEAAARQGEVRTLEQISSGGRQASRGRAALGNGRRVSTRQQNSREAAVLHSRVEQRRSVRPGLRNSAENHNYAEVTTNVENGDASLPAARSLRSARSVNRESMLRRSVRPGLRNSAEHRSYADVPSDGEDEEASLQPARSRRPTRNVAQEPVQHRSVRPGLRNSAERQSHADIQEDENEESIDEEYPSQSHRSTRSGLRNSASFEDRSSSTSYTDDSLANDPPASTFCRDTNSRRIRISTRQHGHALETENSNNDTSTLQPRPNNLRRWTLTAARSIGDLNDVEESSYSHISEEDFEEEDDFDSELHAKKSFRSAANADRDSSRSMKGRKVPASGKSRATSSDDEDRKQFVRKTRSAGKHKSHEHHSSHVSEFEVESENSESDLEEAGKTHHLRNRSTRKVRGTRRRSNRNNKLSDSESDGSEKGTANIRSTRNRSTLEVNGVDNQNKRGANSSLNSVASETNRSSRRSPRRGNFNQVNSGKTNAKRNNLRKRERSDSDSSHQKARTRSRSSADHKSYIEPASSEFGSDASDNENVSPSSRPKKKQARRKPSQKVETKPKKVKSRAPKMSEKKRQQAVDFYFSSFAVSKWPMVALGHITKVATALMERLQENDEQGIFTAPVVEAYPSIQDEYLAAVSCPMDFRTIREDRIQLYRSITDMQEDLILVFGNCMTFNEEGSALETYARSFLEQLHEVYVDVCRELGVRFLHHS